MACGHHFHITSYFLQMKKPSFTPFLVVAATAIHLLTISESLACGGDSLSLSASSLPHEAVMWAEGENTSRQARWEVGVSAGSSGVGVDLSSYVTSYLRLRAGVDYVPHFSVPMHFSLDTYTSDGNFSGKFDKLQSLMRDISGIEVDQQVDMEGKPRMTQFKLLVDIFPLRDKRWYVTVGFYAGGATVAKACNTMGEMPTLLAVNMYNRMYDYVLTTDFWETPIYDDIYLDPDMAETLYDKFSAYGEMGIHVGDFKDGRPYMMKPGTDGMVRARAKVNRFRPYVGLGFTGTVDRARRVSLGVDCGALFWGGAPDVITHEGVNLTDDVTNIRGKVGDYMKVIRKFEVYPILNVRLAYRIF